MSIGTFTLIKNEIFWIKDHLDNLLPFIDEMVFFDGNSTDGTLEVIEKVSQRYPDKVRLFKNCDPTNLQDDYVDAFNACLHKLNTDWAFFCHPDMWVENPIKLRNIRDWDGIAMSSKMISYAGDPGKQLYRIENGRQAAWKNIYRLREPDLGAHYYGHYGSAEEDIYFRAITGSNYDHHGDSFHRYPYQVLDSGLSIHHFSDVRLYERRLERMKVSLKNQRWSESEIEYKAKTHPRVTLEDGNGFKFVACEDPRRAVCLAL